jgi:hypothetical protein
VGWKNREIPTRIRRKTCRKRGKPRTRWIENVEDDLKKMGIKRWRLTTDDRREWRGISEVARVVQEL